VSAKLSGVSRAWTPKKKTVDISAGEVRVSRIRRDPVHVKEAKAEAEKKLQFRSSEREIWIAVLGVLAFALAIDIIVVAVSAYTGDKAAAEPPRIVISDSN
jgi:hypothetical protein